eukprot:scaffold97340_cov40-Prasinocladus_malaysianus.AAC.1
MVVATTPLRRFVLGTYWMIVGFNSLPMSEIAKHGATVLNEYRKAGSPREMRSVFATSYITSAMSYCSMAEFHTGCITGGTGQQIAAEELHFLDPTSRVLHYLLLLSWDAIWEPTFSTRLTCRVELALQLRSEAK